MNEHTVVGDVCGGILIIVFVGTLIPFYAVAARRLHDTGKSGWWILIKFIPLVGALVLLILLAQPSQSGTNKYGPSLS